MSTLFPFEIKFVFLNLALIVLFLFDISVLIEKRFRKKQKIDPREIKILLSSSKIKEKTPFISKIINPVKKYYLFLGNILCLVICIYGFYLLFSPKPRVINTYPKSNKTFDSYESPIEIEFNVPVLKEKITPNINPEVKGKWEFDGYSNLPWTRKIRFIPQHSFPLDGKIMIYLSFIANEFHPQAGNEYLLEFNSASISEVVDISPKDETTDTLADSKIMFFLDDQNNLSTKWRFEAEPPLEFETIHINKDLIVLQPKENLRQGQPYIIKGYHSPATYDLVSEETLELGEEKLAKEIRFTTVKAPLVSHVSPQGQEVKVDSEIVVQFDDKMNQENVTSHITINPEIQQESLWSEDGKTLTLKPADSLIKDTGYEVVLKTELANFAGGVLEEDLTYSFKTIGAVTAKTFSPVSTVTNVSVNSSIGIGFSQEVNHQSAQEKFHISPSVRGVFSWNGNIMIFTPSGSLNFNTTYTYTLDSGIISIYGLASKNSYANYFTTKSQTFMLYVPLYNQLESFTCNIAATRMMLAHRGVNVSEQTLKNQVGTNGSKGNGNPHKGYTLNYGTYWEPISKAVGNYRSNQVYTNWNLTALLAEVEKGNPVMVWGQNGWSTPIDVSWTASDDTYIYAISGMHSYIVKGFIGSKENPTSIIINDPWRGELYMAPSVFKNRWSYFKTAMVVY